MTFMDRFRRGVVDTSSLSERELEILQLLAEGATTRQVASDLGISPHVVKTHLERIFAKLGVGTIRLAAVNVATPTVLAEPRGERVWSGIRKRPVDPTSMLWVSELNLSGDGQADLSVHGGPDKAVYAYPSEHLVDWTNELGQDLGSAPFGENLSTVGVLEQEVRIGDVWRWGSALLQVTQPRWPCFKLSLYREQSHIGVRLRETARTGWYLRVLGTGEVPARGPIEVEAKDPVGVSVHDAHLGMLDRALLDPERLRALIDHPALAEQWRAPLLKRFER
jgi:MOSC domain-containing protein YiiM/DNA-binding CsgD family transcriptional regulator